MCRKLCAQTITWRRCALDSKWCLTVRPDLDTSGTSATTEARKSNGTTTSSTWAKVRFSVETTFVRIRRITDTVQPSAVQTYTQVPSETAQNGKTYEIQPSNRQYWIVGDFGQYTVVVRVTHLDVELYFHFSFHRYSEYLQDNIRLMIHYRLTNRQHEYVLGWIPFVFS